MKQYKWEQDQIANMKVMGHSYGGFFKKSLKRFLFHMISLKYAFSMGKSSMAVEHRATSKFCLCVMDGKLRFYYFRHLVLLLIISVQ